MLATGILFRRDRKGHFILHAKKLQGILMFSLKVEENKQFNQTDLSNWLADNYSFFGFNRNIPKRVKRYKILEEIDLLLEPLLNLGLINKITNNGSVLLQYTIAGRLLALIIDSFDLERRIEDNRKIYEILKSHNSPNKPSKNQFFLALITVYHHQNILDDLTEILRRILVKAVYIPIIDLMDVYEIVQISYFGDLVKANLFLQNWYIALNNLEPLARELFLYDIKLVYESRMGDNKDLGDQMFIRRISIRAERKYGGDSITGEMHQM